MDPLESYRLSQVLPLVRGRLLDLACGYNNLVRAYGSGVGADVFRWEGVDVVIEDPGRLPFLERTFDTVSIVAALNHIPNRSEALGEVWRVLRPDGILLATMIGPWTGWVAHILFHQDEHTRGGMEEGEVKGLSPAEMRKLLREAGFKLLREEPFQLGLNRLYAAARR